MVCQIDETVAVKIAGHLAYVGNAIVVFVGIRCRRNRIEANVANIGWMATATDHAAQVLDIAKPVRVRLELVNAELVSGDMVVSLGVLPGTGGGAAEARTVAWTVRVRDDAQPARATIVVESQKAGTVRQTLELPGSVSPPQRVGGW